VHLVLGRNYERTVVGTKQVTSGTDERRISPAVSQLLFAFATTKDTGSWSVRKLAEIAGLSKSNMATPDYFLFAPNEKLPLAISSLVGSHEEAVTPEIFYFKLL